jgi:5-methylcytosine-specific restriction endonuclease McrA
MTTTTTARAARNQGSNWIRRSKRERIYATDNHACVYCGVRVSTGDAKGRASVPGTQLATLDHVVSIERGGDNSAENLLTSCLACNASKGSDKLGAFLARNNASLLMIAASLVGGAL